MCFPRYCVSSGKAFPAHLSLGMRISLQSSGIYCYCCCCYYTAVAIAATILDGAATAALSPAVATAALSPAAATKLLPPDDCSYI